MLVVLNMELVCTMSSMKHICHGWLTSILVFPYFQLLIQNGAIVSLTNKDRETPLDKVKENLQEKLKGEGILKLSSEFINVLLTALAVTCGQDLAVIQYQSMIIPYDILNEIFVSIF